MPTLLERSRELRELAGRLTGVDAEKGRFSQLETRTAQVKAARNEMESAQKAVRLLDSRGLHLSSCPRPSAALRAKAPALRKALDEDWRAFADERSLATSFLEPVKSHAAKLVDAALVVWQAHVDDGLPSIRDGVINSLAAAGFQTQCARLRHLRGEVATLRRSCPTSLQAFSQLDELKAGIQAIWTELEGVPEDVRQFLQKAARREAAIADLTPGIRSWLDDRGMLGQLRIGLG